MNNVTTVVADNSAMLPIVTAQTVVSERGLGGRIRIEELSAQTHLSTWRGWTPPAEIAWWHRGRAGDGLFLGTLSSWESARECARSFQRQPPAPPARSALRTAPH